MTIDKVYDKCYVIFDKVSKKYVGVGISIYNKKPMYSNIPTEMHENMKTAKEFIFKHQTEKNNLVIHEFDLLSSQSKNVLCYTPDEILMNQVKDTLVDYTFYYRKFTNCLKTNSINKYRYLVFVEKSTLGAIKKILDCEHRDIGCSKTEKHTLYGLFSNELKSIVMAKLLNGGEKIYVYDMKINSFIQS